ncbi:MAG: iron ABC transporter permease [Nitrospira sp.]|nr:iron ABC transporter permease [Nitrospira sp.]
MTAWDDSRRPAPSFVSRHRWAWGLSLVLAAASAASLMVGRYAVPPGDILGFFMALYAGGEGMDASRFQELHVLLLDVRLPRIVAAMLIGAALASSGTAFQALFMNPLVSPGLLGVLAGASFGAALAMVFFDHWLAVQVSAFLFGLIAVGLALGIAALYRANSLLILVLGGIISTGLFASLLSLVKFVADPYDQLPAIVMWLMGRLSNVDARTVTVLVVPLLAGMFALGLSAKYLNVLSMGDGEATALGVNVRRIRCVVIFWATLISALTVVMAGRIEWIGLVIPHVARFLVGPNNEILVPFSAVLGALFLLIVDNIARNLFPVEVPVGVVTELIGIPIFLFVLLKTRKEWA